MACDITPEICQVINETLNAAFFKVGLYGFLGVLLLVAILYYFIIYTVNKKCEEYKAELEKKKSKDIELWIQQKELLFKFVVFFETKVFSNPNLEDEKKEIFKELNSYYGQLYLVAETDVLKKINEYIKGTTSNVQRYYLYKEFRKQLRKILNEKIGDADCPYIAGDPKKAPVFKEIDGTSIESKPKNFTELKEHYSFVENSENEKEKYKTLPFFGE